VKKGFLLVLGFVLVFSGGILFAGGSQESGAEAETVKLKWSHMFSEDHPTHIVNQMIIDEIYKRSDGKIVIEQYGNGVLGKETDIMDMVRGGSVAMISSGTNMLTSFYDPLQVAFWPYIFEDLDHFYRFFNSKDGQAMFDEIREKTGIMTINVNFLGARNITTKGIPVTKPSDLSGVKMRCMTVPIVQAGHEALGANPVPIAFSELYFALQTGVVQSQENPAAVINDKKFYEVQDHIIISEHSLAPGVTCVSEKIWNTLPEEYQKIILEVEKEYRPEQDKMTIEQEAQLIEQFKKRGMTVMYPDKAAFIKSSEDMWKEKFAAKADWNDFYLKIKSYK
jgi:tripartite ATP-independent transporter DctP family solute receptor